MEASKEKQLTDLYIKAYYEFNFSIANKLDYLISQRKLASQCIYENIDTENRCIYIEKVFSIESEIKKLLSID